MIVLDASAAVEVVLGTDAGVRISRRVGDASVHAPHVLDLEVAHVLRRASALGHLREDRAEASLRDFLDMPIMRHEHNVLLRRIWELRENLSAYDASYVSLAEVLDSPLLTLDRRLAAAPGHRAEIEVV